MRMIHSVVKREKPPSKRPRIRSSAIYSFYSAYEVDTLMEVSLGILNTDIRR